MNPPRIHRRLGIAALALAALLLAVGVASIFVPACFAALPGNFAVVGVAHGSFYCYWDTERPDMPMTEFAARLRDFDDFPLFGWPGLSSIGAVLPFWVPVLAFVVAGVLLYTHIPKRKPA